MKNKQNIQSRRSFIFTPGLKPEMFPKALNSGADMVCVELEDGIAPKDKEIARKLAIKIFKEKKIEDSIERILRINFLREKFGIDEVKSILENDFVVKINKKNDKKIKIFFIFLILTHLTPISYENLDFIIVNIFLEVQSRYQCGF